MEKISFRQIIRTGQELAAEFVSSLERRIVEAGGRRWRRYDRKVSLDKLDNDASKEAFTTTDEGRQAELSGSTSREIRIVLAQNPALSPDVQRVLATDAYEEVRASLAVNPALVPEIQKILYKDKIEVRAGLAENPSLTPQLMLAMARKPNQSEMIIKSLTVNPNLSAPATLAILPQISSWKKQDLYKNNKNPEVLKALYTDLRDKTINDPAFGTYEWRQFLQSAHMDEELQNDVANYIDKADVAKSLVYNPSLSEPLRERIYQQHPNDKEILKGLALTTTNPQLQMSIYEGGQYKDTLTENPHLDKQLILRLIAENRPNLNNKIAQRASSESNQNQNYKDPEVINALLGTGDGGVLKEFSENHPSPEMQTAILRVLDAHPDIDKYAKSRIVENLAGLSDAIPEAQKYLIRFGDSYDKKKAIERTESEEVMNFVLQYIESPEAKKNSESGDLLEALAENKKIPEAIQEAIFNKHHIGSMENLAANPVVSSEFQQRIAEWAKTQPEDDVRSIFSYLSSRADLAPALQEDIFRGGNEQAKRHLAEKINLLPQLQGELAKSDDSKVRLSISKRGDILPEVAELLKRDTSYDVKEKLLDNEAVGADVKEYIGGVQELAKEYGLYSSYSWRLNPKLPDLEKQKELLQMGDGFINKRLARYTSEPEIMRGILDLMEKPLLLKLAENISIDDALQNDLVDLGDKDLDQTLLEQEHVSPDVKQKLFARYGENPEQKQRIIQKLLNAGALSVEQQRELYEAMKGNEISRHSKKEVSNEFKKLIMAKNFDPALQLQVAQSKNLVVRAAMAQSPHLTPEVQLLLARDRAPSVRYALSQNEELIPEVQNILVRDKDARIVTQVMERTELSPEIQKIIIKNETPEIRGHLLNKPNLLPEIQLALTKDPVEKVRAAYAYNGILTPQLEEILSKDESPLVRKSLVRRPGPLSSQMIEKFIRDPDEEVQLALVKREDFPPELYPRVIAAGPHAALRYIAEKSNISDEIKRTLASSEFVNVRNTLASYQDTLPEDVIKTLAQDEDMRVRVSMAERGDIPNDILLLLAKDPEAEVIRAVKRRRDLAPEVRIMLQDNVPEGFSKENFVARVHKNKYVFRILEKYMEDNKLTQLTPKDFKGTPIEKYYQQPLVNAMFRQNNGKPLSLEHIHKAIETLEAKEYYILHGTMGSGIQSASQFKDIPRHSFALLFKDLESDPETLAFMKDVAPKLGHGDHGQYGGWGNMNMGWILWKDISEVMGYPSILIEQVQSDWRGLLSKIRAMRDDINDRQSGTAKQLLDQWEEKYGEDSLNRIQKNVDELVRDYPEKILAEFLSQPGVRGKTVFMTGKETQQRLIGHSSNRPDVLTDNIYDKVPRALGFKDSDELKGFLKLERANMKYRKLIRQGAEKLLKEAFDLSGIDEQLKENVGILGGSNVVGYKAVQLHGPGLNRMGDNADTITKQDGSKITIQSKDGLRMVDLANATYLRVDSFRDEVRFSMDPHA